MIAILQRGGALVSINFFSECHEIKQSSINNCRNFLKGMKVTLLLVALTTLVTSTSISSINLQQSFATYSYAAYPNDTCAKLMLTPNYFFRLGTNNVISAVNKTSLVAAGTLLNYTYTNVLGAQIKPNTIQDFDVDHNQSLITLAQPSSTNILSLMGFNLKKATSTAPFAKIEFTNYVLKGTIRNANGQPDILYQGQLSAALLQSALAMVLTPNTLTGVQNCDSVHSPNHNFQLYWDKYSDVFVFNVTNANASPVLLGKVSSNCTVANRTQTIAFSSDSNYFLIEADGEIPVKIVSLKSESLLSFRAFPFNGTITKAMFIDGQNGVIALFNDTAVTFIEAATFTVLNTQQFSFNSFQIEVDYTSGKFYVCKNSSVDVYNSTTTVVICPNHCSTCLEPTKCKVCSAGYILQNDECEQDPSAANNSTPANGTTPSNNNTTSVNNTSPADPRNHPTSNLTNNDTDQNYLILVMPDGSLRIFQMSVLQSLILNSTIQTLDISNSILEHVMMGIASTPLLYLVLSNLQFFTIGSLYAFLHMPLPANIFDVLVHTAAAINSNMFTALGITLIPPPMGEERIESQLSIQMGASSQFVQSNYQFFILSLLSLIVANGLKGVLSRCKRSRFLYGLLHHSTSDVGFGLIVSAMMPFLLPYLAVFTKPYSSSFLDKLNQCLEFIAIGLGILVGGLFIACVGVDEAKPNKPGKKEKVGGYFSSLMKEMDNLHMIAINLFCPLLVMIAQPHYFLLLNPILMAFGLWTATLPCKWRANKVILSIHPILFHFCFVVFQFSSDPDVIINTELACLIIYCIGSAHELLTMLFSLIYYIYRLISTKKPNNKVQPLVDKLQEKTEIWHFKIGRPTASNSMKSKLPMGGDLGREASSSNTTGANSSFQNDSRLNQWTFRNKLARSRFVKQEMSAKPVVSLSKRQGKQPNDNK